MKTNDESNQIRTMRWGTDSLVQTIPTPPQNGPRSLSLTIRGQSFYTITAAPESSSNRVTATVKLGAAFSGARELVLTTADGETFAGTLDGKALKPFTKNGSPESFADGTALPKVSVDERSQAELAAFEKALKDAPDACKGSSASSSRLLAEAIPGHDYDRLANAECIACVNLCVSAAFACEAATIIGCAPSASVSYGIAAIICTTIGTIVCIVGSRICEAGCLGKGAPSPCCPKVCGANCCGDTDSCLNLNQGTCCPAHHPKACGGKSCCLADDQCDERTGTCCGKDTTPCGSLCCPTGTRCNVSNGQCCAAGASTCGDCGGLDQRCCDKRTCGFGLGCSLTSNTCVKCPDAPVTRPLVNMVQHIGSNCAGNNAYFTCQAGMCIPGIVAPAKCDPGFRLDKCDAEIASLANGSVCTAAEGDACSCIVRIQTPNDCSKWVDCKITVTETQSPTGCR